MRICACQVLEEAHPQFMFGYEKYQEVKGITKMGVCHLPNGNRMTKRSIGWATRVVVTRILYKGRV